MNTARRVELAGLQVQRVMWDGVKENMLLIYCLDKPPEADSPLLSDFMWAQALTQQGQIVLRSMRWSVAGLEEEVHVSTSGSDLHVVAKLHVEKKGKWIGVDLVETNHKDKPLNLQFIPKEEQ
ncbi:MAG: hypothetical protein WC526_03480 [Patescibacteria group bacterium]